MLGVFCIFNNSKDREYSSKHVSLNGVLFQGNSTEFFFKCFFDYKFPFLDSFIDVNCIFNNFLHQVYFGIATIVLFFANRTH